MCTRQATIRRGRAAARACSHRGWTAWGISFDNAFISGLPSERANCVVLKDDSDIPCQPSWPVLENWEGKHMDIIGLARPVNERL